MGYEPRTFQSTTANTPPTGTDPMVDNTVNGDVQAIKIIDGTAGSTTPLAGQKARAISLSVTLSTEDIAALTPPGALSDYATQTTLAAVLAKLSADPASQTTLAAILAKLIAAPATETKQDTQITALGALTETAPASDTASSGLNGRLQRIAQRITSLIALLPTALGAGGGLKVDGSGTALPVSGTFWQATQPVSMATAPALVAGSAIIGKVGIDQTTPGTTDSVTAKQSGTWTMQPGNTQNTTPWLASPLATTIDVTVTRPNDTTAYAANDELSDSTSAPAVITITGAARASGGTLRLVSARLIDSANQATKIQALVFLFDTTTTPGNDNAAFAPTDTVMNTCVGVLPFNIWYPGDDTSGATGNAVSPYLGPVLNIKTSGSANLFARVKVLNAYTPVANEALKLRLDFIQD